MVKASSNFSCVQKKFIVSSLSYVFDYEYKIYRGMACVCNKLNPFKLKLLLFYFVACKNIWHVEHERSGTRTYGTEQMCRSCFKFLLMSSTYGHLDFWDLIQTAGFANSHDIFLAKRAGSPQRRVKILKNNLNITRTLTLTKSIMRVHSDSST